ncbi:MAG TPA: TatD family hydrolase [Bacillota bacterium]
MRIVETHAHLDFEAFDGDRDQVLERARGAGVAAFVNVAIQPDAAAATLALADAHPDVYASVGIHPHEASRWSAKIAEAVESLQRLARHPKVVSLGEMGLDFYRDYAPADAQYAVFEAQLALAVQLKLPVIIHCRAAYDQVLARLKPLPGERVLLHCFSGEDHAAECAERGYYIGIGGVITYPSAGPLRRVVEAYPRDRVVVETDCPFLAPQPRRGRRNEPAYLTWVIEALGRLWGVPAPEAAEITTRNASRFFGWG